MSKKLNKLCLNINNLKNLKLDAVSVHIGSQILSENPFNKTLKVLEEIIIKQKSILNL